MFYLVFTVVNFLSGVEVSCVAYIYIITVQCLPSSDTFTVLSMFGLVLYLVFCFFVSLFFVFCIQIVFMACFIEKGSTGVASYLLERNATLGFVPLILLSWMHLEKETLILTNSTQKQTRQQLNYMQ